MQLISDGYKEITGVTSHPLPCEKKLYYKNITSQANIALKCIFWKIHIFIVILLSGSQSLPLPPVLLLRPLQPHQFSTSGSQSNPI